MQTVVNQFLSNPSSFQNITFTQQNSFPPIPNETQPRLVQKLSVPTPFHKILRYENAHTQWSRCAPVNISSCNCFVKIVRARRYNKQELHVFFTSAYSSLRPPTGSTTFCGRDVAIFFRNELNLFDTERNRITW